MRPAPPHEHTAVEVRTAASSPAPTDSAALSTVRSSGDVEEPELRADAGAPERTDADSGTSAAERGEIGEEETLFAQGKAAYKSGLFPEAIKAFTEQGRKHPRGRYAGMSERLLILSLIGAGRKAEARPRVERLRRANPESPTVKELEAALNAAN